MPLSSVWAGPARNEHLDGPPLFYAETSGSTPFRFSTHVGDVGHMLIVGPTGAGKSVLLALIALQFRRYPGAQIYIFDKGYLGARRNAGDGRRASCARLPMASLALPAVAHHRQFRRTQLGRRMDRRAAGA